MSAPLAGGVPKPTSKAGRAALARIADGRVDFTGKLGLGRRLLQLMSVHPSSALRADGSYSMSVAIVAGELGAPLALDEVEGEVEARGDAAAGEDVAVVDDARLAVDVGARASAEVVERGAVGRGRAAVEDARPGRAGSPPVQTEAIVTPPSWSSRRRAASVPVLVLLAHAAAADPAAAGDDDQVGARRSCPRRTSEPHAVAGRRSRRARGRRPARPRRPAMA